MRKLISIFSFISIIPVSSINTIACNNSNNNILKYEINKEGDIIYNFEINKSYIFGYEVGSSVKEKEIFLYDIPY